MAGAAAAVAQRAWERIPRRRAEIRILIRNQADWIDIVVLPGGPDLAPADAIEQADGREIAVTYQPAERGRRSQIVRVERWGGGELAVGVYGPPPPQVSRGEVLIATDRSADGRIAAVDVQERRADGSWGDPPPTHRLRTPRWTSGCRARPTSAGG